MIAIEQDALMYYAAPDLNTNSTYQSNGHEKHEINNAVEKAIAKVDFLLYIFVSVFCGFFAKNIFAVFS